MAIGSLSVPGLLAICVIVGSLVWLALRDHRAQRRKRHGLLDDCARLLTSSAVTHDGDGFPRIRGMQGRRAVDVRLISDGMTIRRLPQLWLQVTELARYDNVSGISVLVRPTGYEFFSLTSEFHHILDAPRSFPREVIVRGEDAHARELLARLAAPMAVILNDPRVKEIAVTRRGLRVICQADEGRRGEYLLLRQAFFDNSRVPAETLAGLLVGIGPLRAAIEASSVERVPA